jgi:hypothetical protein
MERVSLGGLKSSRRAYTGAGEFSNGPKNRAGFFKWTCFG